MKPTMSNEKPKKLINVETIITIAIALISLTGAMLGVIHGSYARQINKTQRKALSATINREQVDVIAHTWMFQDLRAFAEYNRLNALATITEIDAQEAETRGDRAHAQELLNKVKEYQIAAAAKATFFSPQYVLPDGNFDEESFQNDQYRFGSRNLDVNPDKSFEKVEQLIRQASLLRTGIYVFSVVVACLIFAKVAKSKLRYLWVTLAILIFLGNIIFILIQLQQNNM